MTELDHILDLAQHIKIHLCIQFSIVGWLMIICFQGILDHGIKFVKICVVITVAMLMLLRDFGTC